MCLIFITTALLLVADSSPAAEPAAIQGVDDEIRQLKAVIASQRDEIESLRSRIAGQQAVLERLEARVNGGAAPVAVSALRPSEPTAAQVKPASEPQRWYERIGLRGYSQVRYNRLGETNPNLTCEQCDRSIGNNNGLFIRRARMIFSGDITDRVYMYLQPDFASTSGGLHYGQLRDLYFDVSLDTKKEFRIRVGQSKVPFGFENLQSSQNRAAPDRADALNSAVVNERDLGVYLMYAPRHIRQRFRYLVESGLKGSGDYGVIAAGVYNGQNANRAEANNNLHKLVRFSYPMQLKNGQIIEAGVQAYTGQYTMPDRAATTLGPATLPDRRAAASLIVYPQPFGFQAEYNIGRGQAYLPERRAIESRPLEGGYAQLMYRRKIVNQAITAFLRTQHYSGGKKYEFDARRYLVREQEIGIEWQPNLSMELLGVFTRADRTYEDSRLPNNRQRGNFIRLQLQFNY